MTLIVFMLLVVIVLAVGVRILETGSKVALAIALLVVAGLGVRLVSQSIVIQADANSVLAAEDNGQQATASKVATDSSKSSGDAEDVDDMPAASDVEAAESSITDETQAEITLEAESESDESAADAIDADDTQIQLIKGTRPNRRTLPNWLESEDVRTGEVNGIDTTAVCSGPFEQMGECRPALDEALEQAVSDYIDEYLGRLYGENFRASSVVSYDAEYIRAKLVGTENVFDERRDFSFGPMYQSHALIKFTPEFREVLDERRSEVATSWKQFVVGGRLAGVGLVFGLILLFLAVISGYFRLDTATRGFYTARLQFLAAVAILAVIVAGALLARNVPWM